MNINRNKAEAARKAREVHRQNLKKILEHRLEVARSQGNEQLIRQLEAEMKDL